jgi:hypothetical protein
MTFAGTGMQGGAAHAICGQRSAGGESPLDQLEGTGT